MRLLLPRVSRDGPGDVMSDELDSFVSDRVTRAALVAGRSTHDVAVAVGPFIRWALTEAALPLRDDMLFANYTIERYVASALTSHTDHSRATIRSTLRAASSALIQEQHRSLVQYPRSSPSAPYSTAQISGFRSWASAQPSQSRIASAHVLLGLGFGGGLTGAEIIACRRTDLLHSEAGIDIVIRRSAARTVPILPNWADCLAPSLQLEGDVPLFRPGRRTANPKLITDFVSRAHRRTDLQVRRMRATWIVHHLDAGTPTVPLLEAAGISSPEALERFLPFARTWSDDERAMALRG